MKYVFTMGIGILIAMMVNVNGLLGLHTNVYFSSFLVHIIATIGSLLLVFSKKEKSNKAISLPFYFYGGGFLGAIIIVLNNVTFQMLGVSITVALVLLGQMVTSLIVDEFGLFKMDQVTLDKGKIPGLLVMLLGIILMMFF